MSDEVIAIEIWQRENMIYLQTTIIFVMILFLINTYHGDFLAPGLLACYVYLVSSMAAIIGKPLWQAGDVGFLSFSVTILFLLSVIIGEYFSRKFKVPSLKFRKDQPISYCAKITINRAVMLVLILVALYTLYRDFMAVYQISLRQGNPFGYSAMLKYYRIAVSRGISVNLGFLLTQSVQLISFLSTVFFYIIVNNAIYYKIKPRKNLLMILYILIAWAIYALTSSRGGYINMLSCYLIILICSILKRNGWRFRKIQGRALGFSIIAFVVFIVVFSLLGRNTGKTMQAGGAFNQAVKYLGGSIYSFDAYVKVNGILQGSGSFETLSGINKLLGFIGLRIKNVSDTNLDPVVVGNMSTNVYTSLRRYINDYSILGGMVIGFIIGFFYGTWYKHVKNDTKPYSFTLLMYAVFIFPIFYLSVDEMFLRGVFAAGAIYKIVYYNIIWSFILGILKKHDGIDEVVRS